VGKTVHLVRRPLTGLLYQPIMIDDECGAVDGMRIGRGNWSTQRKPASVPLCPPQIPHDLTWARTRAAAVGISRDYLNYSDLAGPGSSLCRLGADVIENTVSSTIAQQYFNCCLRIHCRWNLFTESLLSNERLLWLRYSEFQAPCHSTFVLVPKVVCKIVNE
jgi:hypothetical protein